MHAYKMIYNCKVNYVNKGGKKTYVLAGEPGVWPLFSHKWLIDRATLIIYLFKLLTVTISVYCKVASFTPFYGQFAAHLDKLRSLSCISEISSEIWRTCFLCIRHSWISYLLKFLSFVIDTLNALFSRRPCISPWSTCSWFFDSPNKTVYVKITIFRRRPRGFTGDTGTDSERR